MTLQDQSATITFLKRPATFGTKEPVVVIETHISYVFLAGDRAYKLKRALKLPYVDFSTAAARIACCEKEVALNGRTAPGLYRGVRRITRSPDGHLAFDGTGEAVDAVVEMVRFRQEDLFDNLAQAGRLTVDLMARVAHMAVRFHRDAPVSHAESGSANIRGVLDINAAGFATSHVFAPEAVAAFDAHFRERLATHAGLLDRREALDHVRRCHGDLHLRNICLVDGVPTIFDCIEFNDRIATTDTLYDLAFLLMDLWHRNLPVHANVAMNRYLDESGDDGGYVLFPFFMALRAAVRAHVTATNAEEHPAQAATLAASARSYFDLARSLLRPTRPRLVAIGGLSGSGKSTVAEALAPAIGAPPGARILESDRLRKALFGVAPQTRLGPEAYRPAVSEKVYAGLCDRARIILADGGTVVVDAVFDTPAHRAAIEAVARALGIPFAGYWLEADPAELERRLIERRIGPSDATPDILAMQLRRDLGPMGWRRLDATRSVEALAGEIAGPA